jgi:hypothetical protein
VTGPHNSASLPQSIERTDPYIQNPFHIGTTKYIHSFISKTFFSTQSFEKKVLAAVRTADKECIDRSGFDRVDIQRPRHCDEAVEKPIANAQP